MKLLQIYNQYRSLFGGEETVMRMTAALVEKHGGQAELFLRSSRTLGNNRARKIRAFGSGFYSIAAGEAVFKAIEVYRPDVVHAHNLYPLISPSALLACRRAGVPVVVSFHNHAQTCPNTDHLRQGRICERCFGGNEIFCVRHNCRKNIFESVAYAGRSYFARRLRLFKDHVDAFIPLTQFAKKRLVAAGFDAARVRVLPNMVDLNRRVVDPAKGAYVAFAGRLSREKGLNTLLEAARRLKHVRFRLAGDGPLGDKLRAAAPPNVKMVGQLTGPEMRAFYTGSRLIVLPSQCFEMCPLVISEAMSHGLPVVASKIGGIPELVDAGRTGLLFEPGQAADLADQIDTLWNDTQLSRQMGTQGRAKAEAQYGESAYYRRLAAIYDGVIGRTVFSPSGR
jgi:glycosyltransferase involved in cell wall biosynthesis